MAVKKLAVSFQGSLYDEIRRQAEAEHESVSRWLADAAERKLLNRRLGEYIAAYETKFGVITDDELAAVEKEWQESP